jgi:integrase
MPLASRHYDTEDDNLRLEALLVLSITLGLRPGKLRKLTWDHIDLNGGVVHCWRGNALNWRFGKMTRKAGIGHWHAHEGRHTAVSIMSSNGVPIQEISDTVGHKSTHVTETVYRHVIVLAIRGGQL